MNTNIAKSFGLAIFLAIGVIAAMFALGLFSTSKATADVGGNHAVTVTVSPTTAGSVAQYTILATGADSNISVGQRVFVTFNASTVVPASIATTNVSVKANMLTNSGTADQLKNPSAITVNGNQVAITIPDMDTPTTTNGDQGILAEAGVTITFNQAAGITNPNLAKTTGNAVPYTVTVHNDSDTDLATSAAYAIIRYVTFSPGVAARGGTVTVSGAGFSGNCTTCAIKLNPQSTTAPTTGAAGSATAFDGTGSIDAAGVFTGSFTASGATAGSKFVWVTDSTNASTSSAAAFVQLAGATPRATTAVPGGLVTVDLVDFNIGAAVEIDSSVTTVGTTTAANFPVASFVINASATSGDTLPLAPYSFTVPATIPPGTHFVTISDDGTDNANTDQKSATFSIDVNSRTLVVTPNSASIGQAITVSGTGFTPGGSIVGGASGDLVVGGGTTLAILNNLTTGETITIASDGSWSFATTLQTLEAFASQVGDAITVTATDSGTLVGTSSGFARTARTLTLDPATGAPGAAMKVSVTGMTVDDGENATTATFEITISAGTLSGTTIFPVNADGTGSGTITVPVDATVGVVTVTATDNAADLNSAARTAATADRAATALLTIPSGTVTVSPASASTGSAVTVTGVNFPPSTTGSVLTFGGASGIPTGGFTTDSLGNFNVVTEVPAATTGGSLTPGTKIIIATVGNISGTTTAFTVPGPSIVLSPASASAEQVVKVVGTGFNALTAATTVNIGTASALPSPAPRAGRSGDLNFDMEIPLLNAGTYTVVVTNATGFTATATFTALATPVAEPVTVNATTTVFEAEIAAESLVRVWYFDNDAAAGVSPWQLFDPRPAFAAANVYTTVNNLDAAFINFAVETTFQGKTYQAGFRLVVITVGG